MAKKFADLIAKMSPEAQARIEKRHKETVAGMPLQELRRARGISQIKLAETMQIKQPTVARLEKRTDLYISTLRGVIEAMGGSLEIVAHFPEGSISIKEFSTDDSRKTSRSDRKVRQVS
ncbi:MAG: XRE family transcriptional regulator [Deltaproteobacteria bacterium]|jgi:transcriptional regulator with XRE-family HTH domain|nr:XRE family transcriptional regulator [Deltaproteobacteria bacterium]